MSSVVDLDQRRSAHALRDVTACPDCGGQWFELRRITPSGTEAGAICLNADGRVSGYTGELHCVACHTEL